MTPTNRQSTLSPHAGPGAAVPGGSVASGGAAGIPETCHVCQRQTATVLALLSSGHVGRLCAACRTCRRGRPFASKAEYYNHTKPHDGEKVSPCQLPKLITSFR